jgi:predicted esterase
MAGSPQLSFIHKFVPPVERPLSQITLLMLHGTGGDESDLLELGRAISPDAALLSPRGQVLENGAPRFFRRHAEGKFDLPDLHHRTADLADFIKAATREYKLNPDRIVVVGFSNGANIAAGKGQAKCLHGGAGIACTEDHKIAAESATATLHL